MWGFLSGIRFSNENIQVGSSLATLDKDVTVTKLQLDGVKALGDTMKQVENSIKFEKVEKQLADLNELAPQKILRASFLSVVVYCSCLLLLFFSFFAKLGYDEYKEKINRLLLLNH
ncbi:uncharacterized protein H6S33_000041 [Morchella sextelata]|uniref:uncharacterized protein n=1 Tax=Morchella sextelata TaxID=1174677 RepID=UPI001D03B5BD|nr:uncharacterized protein H6S33_000041 [Morchella sextelata]KAH0614405.1 hypothetical protein H6S33_000041 [Morchella sextelata]